VDSQGTPLGIMYSAIQNTIRWLEPCALEFVFEDDRGMWTVTIIGADTARRRRRRFVNCK
jgi:hypothetical protein